MAALAPPLNGGSAAQPPDSAAPPPPFIHQASPELRAKQLGDPEHWTLTVKEFKDVMKYIIDTPKFRELKDANRQSVNFYLIMEHFIVPWTKGTGCGLSILVSGAGSSLSPADLMMSHSWAEDAEECFQAFENSIAEQKDTDGSKFDEEKTRVWFCAFAVYQPEDTDGVKISDQLAKKPFHRVIESQNVKDGAGMMVVHTTEADVYRRLWCVYELFAAVKNKVRVFAAASRAYSTELNRRIALLTKHGFDEKTVLRAAGAEVRSCEATCSSPDDEDMILAWIADGRGFKPVDEAIRSFRAEALEPHAKRVIEFAKLNSKEPGIVTRGIEGVIKIASADGGFEAGYQETLMNMRTDAEVLQLVNFLRQRQGQIAFKDIDADGNDELTKAEWAAMFTKIAGNDKVISRGTWFQAFDDTHLFKMVATSLHPQVTQEAWFAFFNKFENGSDKINLTQWNLSRSEQLPSRSGKHHRDRLWRECCTVLATCARNAYGTYLQSQVVNKAFLDVFQAALKALHSLAQEQNKAPAERKRRCDTLVESATAPPKQPSSAQPDEQKSSETLPALPVDCLMIILSSGFPQDQVLLKLFDEVLRGPGLDDIPCVVDGKPSVTTVRTELEEQRRKMANDKLASAPRLNRFLWEANFQYPGVQFLSRDPWFITVPNFLSEGEMDEIVASSPQGAERRRPNRVDSMTYVPDRVAAPCKEKLGRLMNMDADQLENLQLITYEKGGFFAPHRDSGGQRCVTAFIYLDTVSEGDGGETFFHDLDLSIRPTRGAAIVFPNDAKNEADKNELLTLTKWKFMTHEAREVHVKKRILACIGHRKSVSW